MGHYFLDTQYHNRIKIFLTFFFPVKKLIVLDHNNKKDPPITLESKSVTD